MSKSYDKDLVAGRLGHVGDGEEAPRRRPRRSNYNSGRLGLTSDDEARELTPEEQRPAPEAATSEPTTPDDDVVVQPAPEPPSAPTAEDVEALKRLLGPDAPQPGSARPKAPPTSQPQKTWTPPTGADAQRCLADRSRRVKLIAAACGVLVVVLLLIGSLGDDETPRKAPAAEPTNPTARTPGGKPSDPMAARREGGDRELRAGETIADAIARRRSEQRLSPGTLDEGQLRAKELQERFEAERREREAARARREAERRAKREAAERKAQAEARAAAAEAEADPAPGPLELMSPESLRRERRKPAEAPEPQPKKTAASSGPASRPSERPKDVGWAKTPELTLSGIMVGPNGNFAEINGTLVTDGDRISGALVLHVKSSSVLMEMDGRKFTVGVGYGVKPEPRREPTSRPVEGEAGEAPVDPNAPTGE